MIIGVFKNKIVHQPIKRLRGQARQGERAALLNVVVNIVSMGSNGIDRSDKLIHVCRCHFLTNGDGQCKCAEGGVRGVQRATSTSGIGRPRINKDIVKSIVCMVDPLIVDSDECIKSCSKGLEAFGNFVTATRIEGVEVGGDRGDKKR